jgi:hypothetical protein
MTAAPAPAPGPLTVAAANPRWFQVAGDPDSAVYLSGSHIWNNFHDGLGPGREPPAEPEVNDYQAYLDLLTERGHNFIRLWRWEHIRTVVDGGNFHMWMSPQPWRRTGPGTASDGEPAFDLDQLDDAYFERLRDRVERAGRAGIYVAVMLFEGFALHLSLPPENLTGHPFAAGNNSGGIAITGIGDVQSLPLDPRVRAVQEAYLRRVIDALGDLPNLLWEVANESSGMDADVLRFPDGTVIPAPQADSTAWQYEVIGFVRAYEAERGYDRHPIGMTMQFPVPDQARVNDVLFDGPADWISPGFTEDAPFKSAWYSDPPAADGRKVVVSDTDHYAAGLGDALWPWRSFLRGNHPILMDMGIIDVVHPLDESLGVPSFASQEACRWAMGDTVRLARRTDLLRLVPRGELASTGYVLADPGREYVVLDPEGAGFTLELADGTYEGEWFGVETRAASAAGPVTGDGGPVELKGPGGPAVLHLRLH